MTNAVPEVGPIKQCVYFPGRTCNEKYLLNVTYLKFHDDRIAISNNMTFNYKNIECYKMEDNILSVKYVVNKKPTSIVFKFDETESVSEFHQIFSNKVNVICDRLKKSNSF